MPVDAFVPNLVVFAVGQATAWFLLRTGRLCAGGLLSGSLWVLADWALVAKHAFAASGADLLVPLVAMQGIALGAAVWLVVRQWRRRRSATARRRPEIFAEGIAAYLRADLEAAGAAFRRLVRSDPWDAAAWIALGNVARREGRHRLAGRCWWRGLGVDRERAFADFVAHQRSLRRNDRQPVPSGEPRSVGAPETAG